MNQQVKDSLEILSLIRKKFLALTEGVSLDHLNAIPAGFNNNLIWNIIHSPVSTELLTYGRSGLPLSLAEWGDGYRKGTRPDPSAPVTAEMLPVVKKELTASYDRLVSDYRDGRFENYQNYETQFGMELTSIEYAIIYAVGHEMLHLGYAMALKRVVTES